MNIEIEKKYLLKNDSWRDCGAEGVHYAQGYLNQKGNTVRVRIAGNKGFLTIKSKTKGISRLEFEYEIPLTDAEQLLTLSQTPIVEKLRYKIPYCGHVFEVDEFLGDNKGLIIAEVELANEYERVELPSWIGMEVTGDKKYYNSHLAEMPYCKW